MTTSTVELLPITKIVGDAYLVTATNQVWVYTGSLETTAINGYVYKGLHYVEPEFSINTATSELVLNIAGGIANNIKVVIVKKESPTSAVWNYVNTSTSMPARFLQAGPATLPDKYYYGGNRALEIAPGLVLTDDSLNPLERDPSA